MRIELNDPEKQPEKTASDTFIPPKDERRTFKSEIAKMKEMSRKDAWTYFCDYYRTAVIVIIAIIIGVISIVHSVIRNSRPFVLEVYCYNNYVSDGTDQDTLCEEFAEHMGVNLDDYQMTYSTDNYFDPTQYGDEYTTTIYKLAAMVSAAELDIAVGDRTFIDNYGNGTEDNVFFYDLSEILPSDLYTKLEEEDRFYYAWYTDEDGNKLEKYPCAVDVSGTRLTEEGGLLSTPCYAGIICNTERLDNSIEFLRWIFYMSDTE